MIESVSKSFNVMEATARSYREKAIDQKEDFQETAAALNQRGISGPVSIHFGWICRRGGYWPSRKWHCMWQVCINLRGWRVSVFMILPALHSRCGMESHGVWSTCAMTLAVVQDYTHVFYKKLVQSGGIVQTPDRVQTFLQRWSTAASLLMKVEDVIVKTFSQDRYHRRRVKWNGHVLGWVGGRPADWCWSKASRGRAHQRHWLGVQDHRRVPATHDAIISDQFMSHCKKLWALLYFCEWPVRHDLLYILSVRFGSNAFFPRRTATVRKQSARQCCLRVMLSHFCLCPW